MWFFSASDELAYRVCDVFFAVWRIGRTAHDEMTVCVIQCKRIPQPAPPQKKVIGVVRSGGHDNGRTVITYRLRSFIVDGFCGLLVKMLPCTYELITQKNARLHTSSLTESRCCTDQTGEKHKPSEELARSHRRKFAPPVRRGANKKADAYDKEISRRSSATLPVGSSVMTAVDEHHVFGMAAAECLRPALPRSGDTECDERYCRLSLRNNKNSTNKTASCNAENEIAPFSRPLYSEQRLRFRAHRNAGTIHIHCQIPTNTENVNIQPGKPKFDNAPEIASLNVTKERTMPAAHTMANTPALDFAALFVSFINIAAEHAMPN